ncbi:DUF4011 domain-containing protein [Alienimonas californiensis]|uniref:ATP-dependent RecD-like DNA helicase n=1 Tax=Alienimonas californiensis TaxID=2527989 RepID=A0A517P6Q4_9PLAN|nr:DUF4011 domain-containing protein [Alienimonas californiensis]QDT15066.1 ATP-dependent RecD-like DNA helicase [Alienimonas californiensis]
MYEVATAPEDRPKENAPGAADADPITRAIGRWREKLLEISNRNPLINCSFSPSRGVVELLAPSPDAVWRRFAADSAAGESPMRFPWKRDLADPPADPFGSEARSAEDETGDELSDDGLFDPHPTKSLFDKSATRRAGDAAPASDGDDAPEPSIEDCLAALGPDDLLTGLSDKKLDGRLRTLEGHAKLSLSEQGVHSVYAVFGFLRWYESKDSEEARLSPLVLVPAGLSRAATGAPWSLVEAEDEALGNDCLRERLRGEFGIDLPPLPEVGELEEEGALAAYFAAIAETVAAAASRLADDRWGVEERAAVGRFAFPKIAMWRDLGDHAKELAAHPLCRTIAGGTESRGAAFGPVRNVPEANELDETFAPGEVAAILDCDSTQLRAIAAARAGVSFVLDGPPGTGKSQTIANVIADALGAGRTVLFVSEKVAALDVVKARLDAKGLGDFVLACHSDKANRRDVVEELGRCLNLPAERYPDAADELSELRRRRDRLNRYVRALHEPRGPLGRSAFEVHGRLAELARTGAAGKTRWAPEDPAGTDRETLVGLLEAVGRAPEHADVLARFDSHPWRGTRLTTNPLGLADDLGRRCGTLATAFGRAAAAFAPLVERGLIPAPSRATVNAVFPRLKEAAAATPVPAGWVAPDADPAAAAAAVLSRRSADAAAGAARSRLTDYEADVADRFPDDAVRRTVELDATAEPFGDPAPTTVRTRLAEANGRRERAAALIAAVDETTAATKDLAGALQVGVSPELSAAALTDLAAAAGDAATALPVRAAWLDLVRAEELSTLVGTARASIAARDSAAGALDGRVARERIAAFLEAAGDPGAAAAAWEAAGPHAPVGTDDALAVLAARGARAGAAAEMLADAGSALGGAVWGPGEWTPTVAEARTVAADAASAGPALWTPAAERVRLRTVAEEAAADLEGAAAIREGLADRLSHRAFRPSAAELATRAVPFESFFKRLFGGFGAFRREVADLYSGEPPATKALLSDLAKLRAYHARTGDAAALAAEHAGVLPDGFAGAEATGWRELAGSLAAADRVAAVRPDAAVAASSDPAAVAEAAAKTTAVLADLDAAGRGLFPEEILIAAVAAEVREIGEAATACRALLGAVGPLRTGGDPSVAAALDDLRASERFATAGGALEELAGANAGVLAEGADPLDPAAWERVAAGVRAAAGLRAAGLSDAEVRTALAAGPDPAALGGAADRLAAAADELAAATAAAPVGAAGDPPAVLREAGEGFLARTAGVHADLTAVADALAADGDPPVDRLPDDLAAVSDLRAALADAAESAATLAVVGTPDPEESHEAPARWLAERCGADELTPLLRAAAGDPAVREAAAHAAAELPQALPPELKASWDWFRETVFDAKAEVSDVPPGSSFRDLPLGEAAERFAALPGRLPELDRWLAFTRWRRTLADLGLKAVATELRAGEYRPEEAAAVVEARFLRGLLDAWAEDAAPLHDFDLEDHERTRARFRSLDRREFELAAARVRETQLGRDDRPRPDGFAGSLGDLGGSELGVLVREANKKRKHLPLRRLFEETAGVLLKLKPCLMMSPLAVSTYLKSDRLRFDLVVFDEASQVFPWDAVGAIFRGSQLIIAGDEKQLPPTNFFTKSVVGPDDGAEEEESEAEDLTDYESILSVCKATGMPNVGLRWHYRSRREALIAFSNAHFYDGELVTFPAAADAAERADGEAPAAAPAVRHEFVEGGVWDHGRNLAEADRVADLVVEHVRRRPDVSLGVIAFNQGQQGAIEDALYVRRKEDPAVDALLHAAEAGLGPDGTPGRETLFVKNLETVQGDERDAILLSVAYGFNPAGKFYKNFGPLNKANGGRRLNVAVTRARSEVTVVSSVRAADFDLAPTAARGAKLLKGYLDFAARGPAALADSAAAAESTGRGFDSPFEADVAAALAEHGLEPVPQVGCGGYRVDLALRHPDRPGEFCLGIECDGAAYHSSATARDRDRIRQAVLENLGWRIVRVWSTDWVRDPARQTARVLKAYEDAVRGPAGFAAPAPPADDPPPPEPTVVPGEPSRRRRSYGSIDEVPAGAIAETIAAVLAGAGATPREDLLRLVARELGFQRLGPRIRNGIDAAVDRALRSGAAIERDGRVSVTG